MIVGAEWMWLILGLAGLIIGSFLNVCIVRLPYDESLLWPGSYCPSCETPIRWRDNVPVISYFLLRGRCRHCREVISWRYPLVEILTAVAFIALYELGLEPRASVIFACLLCAYIVITFIDIDHQIIPDRISIPSIVIAPFAALIIGYITFQQSVLGIIVGAGPIWLIAYIFKLVRGKEGMGLGDVKLMAMIGGYQGWEATLSALMVGSILGSIVGLGAIIVGRGKLDTEIPFGPFLVAGAVFHLFEGRELIIRLLGN